MKRAIGVALIFLLIPAGVWAQSGNLDTSLHGTRAGKNYWYGTANGGFENWTNVPMVDLGCTECHGPTDADGNAYPDPYPGMSCVDCHPTADMFNVSVDQCYGCHGRQATEANTLGISDVHRTAGKTCWFCHGTGDIHGDGNVYDTMFDEGAIDVDCVDCHPEGELSAAHTNSYLHSGKLHCTACHTQTVISCYNCHFESQVDSHVKRAKQPISNFLLLVNREKDGKVYPASFQSLTYQGDAFVAFAPYAAHTITVEGRICTDCHVNLGGSVEAIEQWNDSGTIQFTSWNDTDSTLSWLQGVVPMPADYETSFRMDFITYNGNTADPPGPSKNWSAIGKDTWDGHQMFFATPLTTEQMDKLGFDVQVPVKLAWFEGERTAEGARLTWRVAEASDHAGFHVYRQPERESRVRVSDRLLSGRTEYEFVDEGAPRGRTTYWLEEVSRTGVSSWHGPVVVAAAPALRVEMTARPNPFHASTAISYSLVEEGAVRLVVFDISGRRVQTLLDTRQGPGDHVAVWDGTTSGGQRAAFGQYLIRLETEGSSLVQKVLFVR
jgi:hypothetical protein